jgi:transposase-like protein
MDTTRLRKSHGTVHGESLGRPSKFTPERREAIIDAIRHRIPYEVAAEANGISEETLYEWLRVAKRHEQEGKESEYTLFSEGIKRAEMQKMREHLDVISARPERWQADAWILERRWNQHFGANSQLQELNKRLAKLEEPDLTGKESEDEC